VSSPGPIDFHCRIDSLEEPIEGRISDGRGRSLRFRGWIEFSAALQSLAGDARGEEPNSPQEGIHHE